jgi:hypothetical protein
MSKMRLLHCLVWPCLILTAGCREPQIQTAEHPAALCRAFQASPDRVWDASLGIVQNHRWTVVMQAKSLGLIACKIPDDAAIPQKKKKGGMPSEEEMLRSMPAWMQPHLTKSTCLNIYVRGLTTESKGTTVYVVPFAASPDLRYQDYGMTYGSMPAQGKGDSGANYTVSFSVSEDVLLQKQYTGEVANTLFGELAAQFQESGL